MQKGSVGTVAVIAGAVLTVLVSGAYLVSRIDRAEPLTAEQQVLKPGAVELASDSTVDSAPYLQYLKQSARSPVDYVVEKFKTHDLVLLGEAHQIREDCELIESLIEPLYRQAGVHVLAMEIVKQKRNDEIYRILTAPTYDSLRVVQIFREDYFYWGFQEYLDIWKAAWKFNRSLAPEEEPFRIIGFQPDMNIYRVDCGSLPQKLPEFPVLLRMESLYARPLIEMVSNKKAKVLVQVGYYHSFLNYRQPKVINGKMYGEMARMRMGRILREKLGDRIFQIVLHVRHDGFENYESKPTTPVLSFLERLYAENGNVPIAFDVAGSPFAMLRDTSSYFFAYQKHVTLSDIAEGYILQKPFQELHPVKWVEGFAVPENFSQLRTYAVQRNLIGKDDCATPQDLNRTLSGLLAKGVRFP